MLVDQIKLKIVYQILNCDFFSYVMVNLLSLL
jgi:hypothetical protein